MVVFFGFTHCPDVCPTTLAELALVAKELGADAPGPIVAVFMHMMWERLALMYAIVVPTLLLMVLMGIGAFEAGYTFLTRGIFFGVGSEVAVSPR